MPEIDEVSATNRRFKNKEPWLGPGSLPLNETPEEKREPSLAGKEQLASINKYVDELIRFCYHNCPFKMLAVPTLVPYTLGWYTRVLNEMVATERLVGQSLPNNKAFELKPDEEHWGGYTLTEGMFDIPLSEIAHYQVSVVRQVARVGPMYAGKLIKLACDVMVKNVEYYSSDIRQLMYLEEHLDEVPRDFKNGKANVFVGTTVMIGSVPHVVAATWNGASFDKKFISLWATLKEDIQFVLIRK
ncbi:MAG: hypothetical protein WC791_00090 [Candidatus Paceibacterota bacterium]|jgi:hypothetical protein